MSYELGVRNYELFLPHPPSPIPLTPNFVSYHARLNTYDICGGR